jgi:hypothetical protein
LCKAQIAHENGINAKYTRTHYVTSPAQDKRALRMVMDGSKKDHYYSLGFFNCIDYSKAILEYGKNGTGEERKVIPAEAFKRIAKEVFENDCTVDDIFRYVKGLVPLDENGKAIREKAK